jgi:hypothetical protein
VSAPSPQRAPVAPRVWRFAVLALLVAWAVGWWTTPLPTYTDAFYYYNAGARLASGQGLTDPYLWTYIGVGDSLPTAAHRYWMPLPSLLVAAGQTLFGARLSPFMAAQLPFVVLYAMWACLAFVLGARLGGTARHAWLAGLITLFSGYYVRYIATTSTFAPFGVFGAAALLAGGALLMPNVQGRVRIGLALACGALCGLGHLTRADGLLLLLCVGLALVIAERAQPRRMIVSGMLLVGGYLLMMSPWFARNMQEIGSPLPLGGAQAIWFTMYEDLFSYPADANAATFWASGVVVPSRIEALATGLQTLIAVQGLVVMAPLMLWALWRRRAQTWLWPLIVYAIALHVVMTVVFAYPGMRGGLWHSSAALMPFWAALGVCGMDDAIGWLASKRRTWRPQTAKRLFSGVLLVMALLLASPFLLRPRQSEAPPPLYVALAASLPADARVLVNDPGALYYYTGHGGAVLPNETADIIPALAARYQLDYVLIEFAPALDDASVHVAAVPPLFAFDWDAPPSFLQPVPLDDPHARLYAVRR